MSVNAWQEEESIFVEMKYTDENMDKDVFNFPLTIWIDLPDELQNAAFLYEGNTVEVLGGERISVNLIPGKNKYKIDIVR